MKKLLQKSGFDELDRAILEELQANCRLSNADLARKIHLSQPAVHNRIKRLEKQGIIQRYAAILDRDRIGYEMLCLVQVQLERHSPDCLAAFEQAVNAIPEVLECFRLAGEYDALLKIVVQDNKTLDQFIHAQITTLPGVGRVQTSLVLNEVKSTTALPLE